jgi:hypothetical protein
VEPQHLQGGHLRANRAWWQAKAPSPVYFTLSNQNNTNRMAELAQRG